MWRAFEDFEYTKGNHMKYSWGIKTLMLVMACSFCVPSTSYAITWPWQKKKTPQQKVASEKRKKEKKEKAAKKNAEVREHKTVIKMYQQYKCQPHVDS